MEFIFNSLLFFQAIPFFLPSEIQDSFAFPSIIEMFTIVKSNDLGTMNKALISRPHAILINKSISNGALSQLNEKLLQSAHNIH